MYIPAIVGSIVVLWFVVCGLQKNVNSLMKPTSSVEQLIEYSSGFETLIMLWYHDLVHTIDYCLVSECTCL